MKDTFNVTPKGKSGVTYRLKRSPKEIVPFLYEEEPRSPLPPLKEFLAMVANDNPVEVDTDNIGGLH